MVLVGLLLAYAYPVRVYLAQQAEIAAIEDRQAQQRREIAGLQEEREKYDDPEFIKVKARKLGYVLPGETAYITLGDPAPGAGAPGAARDNDSSTPDAWYQKLWSSVAAADRQAQP
jgi:hypothetical protein